MIVSCTSYVETEFDRSTSHVRYSVKTAWERDERVFMFVTPTRRFWSPSITKWRASDADDTETMDRFSTAMRWSVGEDTSRIATMKDLPVKRKQDIQLLLLPWIQQISNSLVVDIHEGHAARIVDVLLGLSRSDLIKHVVQRAGKNAQHLLVLHKRSVCAGGSQNGVRLSRPRLPVSEDASIISAKAVVRDIPSKLVENRLLRITLRI